MAYHVEALIAPTGTQVNNQSQKLNDAKDVQFFRVGISKGRTLIVYMVMDGVSSSLHATCRAIANRTLVV